MIEGGDVFLVLGEKPFSPAVRWEEGDNEEGKWVVAAPFGVYTHANFSLEWLIKSLIEERNRQHRYVAHQPSSRVDSFVKRAVGIAVDNSSDRKMITSRSPSTFVGVETSEENVINDPPLESVSILPIEAGIDAVKDVINTVKEEGLSLPIVASATVGMAMKKVDKVKKAMEAFGEKAIEKYKALTGKKTDPDFNRRYHGTDDLVRDEKNKLEEIEVKGTGNPKSKPLPAENNFGLQGSASNNKQRGKRMAKKESKINTDANKNSNRIGGPYTQAEVDLWQTIKDDEGQKIHTFIRANQATNKAEVYEQDEFGKLVKKLMEFTVDD